MTYVFNQKDLHLMASLGLSDEVVYQQLNHFKTGYPSIVLDTPATPENGGICVLSDIEINNYIHFFEENAPQKNILKFVPASGAATRMFKDLYNFSATYFGVPHHIKNEFPEVSFFLDNLTQFAFYSDLKTTMKKAGLEIDDYMQRNDYATIINCLLGKQYMGYGSLPKALIKFHKYGDVTETALMEHFTEGLRYAKSKDGLIHLHFTVSSEYVPDFLKEIRTIRTFFHNLCGAKFRVSLSEQKHYTDTIAVDEYNEPIRDEEGNLIFRPGGHGALIENLNECRGDLIFIKNIDNVIPDNPFQNKDIITVQYKKLIGGIFLQVQQQTFEMLSILDNKPSEDDLCKIETFAKTKLCIDVPETLKSFPFRRRIQFLKSKLNRPMRVCGMVKNEGEPGGGPFWVVNGDGTKSLQIVESSQINRKKPDQEKILSQATHFNPVDLACGIKTYKGHYFNLRNFVDPTTGFISKKTSGAKTIKSQELPGLWNGGMADWITIFVEVPLATFNPVKTVNDLLRKEHIST